MNYLETVVHDHTGMLISGLASRGIYLSHDNGSTTLSFHLATQVEGPVNFIEFLELTRCLTPSDVLEVVISGSPGGELHGAQVVTTAMDACHAPIDVVVIGNIASAATMVAMRGTNLIMTQGSSMMIHNASYGVGGKASDIAASVAFSTKDISQTMEYYYRPFLAKKELKLILRGEEMYFSAAECMERFEKVKNKRAKQEEKAKKEYLREQKEVIKSQLADIENILGE